MPEPDKRVVIVTGASRGLGKEIALAFGKVGCRVIVNYLTNDSRAREVVSEIVSFGAEAVLYKADVGHSFEVDALFDEAVRRWGRVDVLINNAAITRDGILLKLKEEDWDEIIDTDLNGPFHTTRAAARIMSKQGNGHIINIASITGIQGREGQANYASAKAGLVGLTKATAKELGRFNVKVNAVLPGFLPTDMGQTVSQDILEKVQRENALHRVSDPREVADFICHLTCMNNVSGQVFNLDSRIL